MVAEYRLHGTSMSNNSALMLKATTTVRRSQWKHVKGNKQYEEAIEEGVRVSEEYYGGRLVSEVRTYVQEREWKRALRGMLALLRYYPRGLTLLNERRMERHRLARRLQRRKQELEAHERRLKELEGAQEPESVSAKEEERQEVQLLRKRVRGLERRTQKLDRRRAQNGRTAGTQKSFKRLLSKRRGRVKGRLLGR